MNDRSNGAPDQAPAHDNGDPDQAGTADGGATRAEQRIAGLDTSAAGISEAMNELSTQLEAATQKAEQAEAGWQRARADFTNFKRRTEEDRAVNATRASDALLLKVVALADDFDLAIDHVPAEAVGSPWMEGIGAIDRKLRQLLENAGVKPMQAEGQPFDPHEHEAISYEDTAEVADGTVLKELQRGYYVADRVLRPAYVAVARNDDMTITNTTVDTDKE